MIEKKNRGERIRTSSACWETALSCLLLHLAGKKTARHGVYSETGCGSGN